MPSYGVPLTENLVLTDSVAKVIERELTETLVLSDGDTYDTTAVLSETITLSDTDSRVWLATPEFSETLNLTDSFTYVWLVSRTYSETLSLTDTELSNPNKVLSETITLTDGDDTEIVQVSPNGGYIAITVEEPVLTDAVDELIKLLEEQGAPKSQTQIMMTHDGSDYALVAIVKRH